MSYVSKNLKEDIKHKVSIIELADEYFGIERKGRLYSIRPQNMAGEDFSSITLYPDSNSYYRWSSHHGGDIISFVMETHIENISTYKQALGFLAKRINPDLNIEFTKREDATRSLSPAERHKELVSRLHLDSDSRNCIAYLIKERGINPEIVSEGIRRGYIRQVVNENDVYLVDGRKTDRETFEQSQSPGKKMFHNVNRNLAFIGLHNGAVSNVCYRGINNASSFKSEEKASDRNWAWIWEIPVINGRRMLSDDSKLYVFEGYVDMLSYLSLRLENGEDINRDMYVSLGSTSKYRATINIADTYGINSMVVAMDNDNAGDLYARKLYEEFSANYEGMKKELDELAGKEVLSSSDQERLGFLRRRVTDDKVTAKRIRSVRKDWNVDLQKKRGIHYRAEKDIKKAPEGDAR